MIVSLTVVTRELMLAKQEGLYETLETLETLFMSDNIIT